MNAQTELGRVRSRTLMGIRGLPVDVEAQLLPGLPKFTIVGLPEAAVRESRDRIRGAMLASGIEFPQRAIVVNLAPADLPKQGGRFDLPIAIAILLAMHQLDPVTCQSFEFIGELSLSGQIRPVEGALPTAMSLIKPQTAKESQQSVLKKLIVPAANAVEAGLCQSCAIYPVTSLTELVAGLAGTTELVPLHVDEPVPGSSGNVTLPDLSTVKGQHTARRALEIACAGCHNLLMVGPPGTGKSLLASVAAGILPEMSLEEAVQTASIQSISHQGFDVSRWRQRPVRSPHHTVSGVALVGGGSKPKPGEISLAHNGVLFLDELAEFPRSVLDVLREPLEAGHVTISRASRSAQFPADFQLIAAMNPCPCGYAGDLQTQCRCSMEQIRRYTSRLSGPLLDRIDLQVGVPRVAVTELKKSANGESSQQVRQRVCAAYDVQLQRQKCVNGKLTGDALEHYAHLNAPATHQLMRATEKYNLSLRAHYRLMRVARTIADLSGSVAVRGEHVLEALSYRQQIK